MATLYTLTGFAYTPLTNSVTNIQRSTLTLEASEDLEFTATPLPDGNGLDSRLSVSMGEIYGVQLDLITPNLSSPQWSAQLGEVTINGATAEVLVLDTSDFVRTFVYVLSGDDITAGQLPTDAEIELLRAEGALSPITTGPFAQGMPFSLRDAQSAVVNDDPFAGTPGADLIVGFLSNDLIDGEGGNDSLFGQFGNDTLLGGAGADQIEGGGGNDVINSGLGGGNPDVADGDTILGIGGFDIVRGTPADFDEDFIGGFDPLDQGAFDFGDLIVIEGVSPDAIFEGPGLNQILIETTGDNTPEASFTYVPVSFGFDSPVPGLVATQDGPNTVLQLDPALAPDAGIGTGITGPLEFDQIAPFLFADNSITPIDLYYVGAIESLALLEDGFEISEISGDTPETVVGIDRGVFLSSGGGPGTENTREDFRTTLREPGDPRLDRTAEEAFEFAGGTRDASLITFTFDAEDLGEQSSISFDLFFGSDEFPEFADSSFVDIAAVYVNGVNYALFNNDPLQPLAIVGESITTPGNFYDNNGDDGSDADPFTGTFDTEYDGFSVLLNVVAPVRPGINTVTIGIADTGDSIYDSGLFIGNIQGSDFDGSGSFVPIVGTDGDDNIDANGAPQLITLGGGADTVNGTPAELNGDVIDGFGEDDALNFEGASFAEEDLTVTVGSAILDIDTDGDGTDDTRVTLQGNFEGAEFAVANEAGNSIITVSDVPVPMGEELRGTEGNDTLTGTDEDDTIEGLGGNDLLSGGLGDDLIEGGDGDDGLRGQEGNDTLRGGAGNDNLAASDGDDLVEGGAGRDLMGGGLGNDAMSGGDDRDFMGGGLGDDTVMGDAGDDVVNGGGGDDSLMGGDGDDTMGASFNDDIVEGGLGNDDMGGGFGSDVITGGAGNDSAGGGEGNDTISGGDGDDFLAGGGRDDQIDGGAGADTINGGDGDDVMSGGAEADLFVFNAFNDGEIDTITDYEDAVDVLRLRGVEGADDTARLANLEIIDTDTGAEIVYLGHTIRLEGAVADDLGLEDFIFI